MSTNEPITRKDRVPFHQKSENANIGDQDDGQARRESRVGRDREVVVTIYRRPNDTHFARISLRSVMQPQVIQQGTVELDRYINESDFTRAVMITAGAMAENLNEKRGDKFSPEEIAKLAAEAAREMLHDIEAEK